MSRDILSKIAGGFLPNGNTVDTSGLQVQGTDTLQSWFDVSGLATATIGMAGLMLAEYIEQALGRNPDVTVDQRLASLWFGFTLRPVGWELPPAWDPIAGDYQARDGWIRLHTNAPHHREAAFSVLGRQPDRVATQDAVRKWAAADLEAAVVDEGGCAAAMQSLEQWREHPQGRAVHSDPLVFWQEHQPVAAQQGGTNIGRPLSGVRVLDLTRVLAGPVAGRFLAGYGAEVLRIDPPHWNEPGVIPEVTLGKRCAGLDLRLPSDRATFRKLLAKADIFLHGYRPGALESLGFGADELCAINPQLIDVSLNAYGWSGPWKGRRGFDSLLQMSSGIAEFGMRQAGAERPVPLPVQALDHATGYLLAASALHALARRNAAGAVLSARLSLARVAHLLSATARNDCGPAFPPLADRDFGHSVERTDWGPAHRVKFPLSVGTAKAAWDYGANNLRTATAAWLGT
jgi:hypothetical protein